MSTNRIEGTIDFPTNFEVGFAAPLDARQVCQTFKERRELTFTYPGMICIVTNDQARANGTPDADGNNPDGSDSNNSIYIRNGNRTDFTQVPPLDSFLPEDPNLDSDWDVITGGSGTANNITAFTYYDDQAAADAAGVNLNDLVIELEDGQTFTVNIEAGEGTYQPQLYNVPLSTIVPNTVGGIAGGSTTADDLDGLTFSEMWNKLLFPAISPGLGSPFAKVYDITTDGLGLFEAGTTWNGTIDLNFGLGPVSSPWPSAPNQGNVSDGIDTATLTVFGNTYDVKTGNASLDDPFAGASGTHVIVYGDNGDAELTIDFLSGQQKVDSTGAPVTANNPPYPGGSSTSTADTFIGTYPIYVSTGDGNWEKRSEATVNTNSYGQASAVGLTASSGTYTISQNWAEGAYRHSIRVPQVFGTVSFKKLQPTTGNYSDNNIDWSVVGTVTIDVNTVETGIAYVEYVKGNIQAKRDPATGPNGERSPMYQIQF